MDKDLIIFDFDYTLAKTIESIWIWSPRGTREFEGNKYIPVHPSVLSKTKLGDDESVTEESFKEFYSLNIKRSKSITITTHLLDYYLSQPEKYDVYIVTARPKCVENEIVMFLDNYCTNLKNLKYIGLQNSDPKIKIKAIKDIILKKEYKNISLYEDNEYMINNICKDLNRKINRYYVQSYGKELRVSCYEN